MPIPVKHLYLHVPFCKGACTYCAFYKEPFAHETLQAWLPALEKEMQAEARKHPVAIETIYMGGGTPSLLEAEAFGMVRNSLQRHFGLTHIKEWSLEANPESVTPQKLDAWQQAGITRISLGVQSLQPEILRNMNRRHDVATIHRAIALIKGHPDWSLGIDLIAGYPGVSAGAWQATLDGVLAFEPDHLSVYECTLHAGSRLSRDIACDRKREMPPRERDRALRLVAKCATAAGYEQYEVSNYSKPGKRCQHNLAVWRGEDYLGLGPGAASRVGLHRWTNLPDVPAYIAAAARGTVARETDQRTPEQDATERIMFAFRLRDPVDLDSFMPADVRLARKIRQHWEEQLDRLQEAGLVRKQGQSWRTSAKGRQMVDHIAEALLP